MSPRTSDDDDPGSGQDESGVSKPILGGQRVSKGGRRGDSGSDDDES